MINENKRRELSGKVNAVQDGMITYNTIKSDPAQVRRIATHPVDYLERLALRHQ